MPTTPADLVWETTTITGTGDFTSLTAVVRTFNSAFGTGGSNLFTYFAWNSVVPGEWEIGTGHLSAAATMVRDTVILSSNANALVSFTAGLKNITNDIPAANQVQVNEQIFTASGTWTKPTVGTFVIMEVWGGGGSGGCRAATGGSGGGGGGGYNWRIMKLSDIAGNITVTIGAGGAAKGPSLNLTGAVGGDTTLVNGGTTYLTAYGGGGGANVSTTSNVGGGGGGGNAGDGATGSGPSGGTAGAPGAPLSVGGASSNAVPATAYVGGGGGAGGASDNTTVGVGGNSIYGGAGGGASNGGTPSAGGTSVHGGAGGAATTGTVAAAGTQPGGGGGGSRNSGTSGAGGDGKAVIRVF
jgi:hypothetical protein